MRGLVMSSCNLAIQRSSWSLQEAWSSLLDAIDAMSSGRPSPLEAALRRAAACRDMCLLKDTVAGVSSRSEGAVAAAQLSHAHLWQYVERVLSEGEAGALRHEILGAALRGDASKLPLLLDAAERLGDQCTLERQFLAELLTRTSADETETTPPGWQYWPRSPGVSPAGASLTAGAKDTAFFEGWPQQDRQGEHEDQGAPEKTVGGEEHAASLAALGLPTDTFLTEAALRSVYRQAALKWHPDRPHNVGEHSALEKFRQARDAYDQLRRCLLDAKGCEELPDDDVSRV
eukprot:TRINITY_DN29641_c0_g1_i2.p1 TRINITY_DN29641_c0_g1~~TRINITY_DN29641_c0_g1_i2.p1  ORF type:complete len:288 (-),score=58.35 TRINITY_DN29641_c0_g1_i2:8-871(-)